MSVLAERIKRRRTAFEMSQEDLAGKIGTSQRQLSKYENGHDDPSAERLRALAEALETTTDWLIGLTDNPERRLRGKDDLNDDERQMLEIYRQKSPDRRKQALDVLKVL